MEGADVNCEMAATAWLPKDVVALTKERYCLYVTLPRSISPNIGLLADGDFELCNQVNHQHRCCEVLVLLSSGHVELRASPILEILDEIKTQFPVLFHYQDSWAFMGYPWYKSFEDGRMRAQFFGADNYRYIPEEEKEDALWQEGRRLDPEYVEPITPDGYAVFRANKDWRTAFE
jgi:hypothetical protein